MDGAAGEFETKAAPAEAGPKSWRDVARARHEKIATPFTGLKKAAEGLLRGAKEGARNVYEFGLALTAKEGRKLIAADIGSAAGRVKEAAAQRTKEAIEGGKRELVAARDGLFNWYSETWYYSNHNNELRRQAKDRQDTLDAIATLRAAIEGRTIDIAELQALQTKEKAALAALEAKIAPKAALGGEIAAALDAAFPETVAATT